MVCCVCGYEREHFSNSTFFSLLLLPDWYRANMKNAMCSKCCLVALETHRVYISAISLMLCMQLQKWTKNSKRLFGATKASEHLTENKT